MDNITENFVTECLLKIQTFFLNLYAVKNQLKSGFWMNG